jgi:hypothetical protein
MSACQRPTLRRRRRGSDGGSPRLVWVGLGALGRSRGRDYWGLATAPAAFAWARSPFSPPLRPSSARRTRALRPWPQLATEPLQLPERAITAAVELGDDRLDPRPPALRLLNDPFALALAASPVWRASSADAGRADRLTAHSPRGDEPWLAAPRRQSSRCAFMGACPGHTKVRVAASCSASSSPALGRA